LGLPSLAATDVRNDAVISEPGGPVAVLRVEAREDAVIARQAAELLTE
jgi:acetate kinase